MSEIRDRLRARVENARAAGKQVLWCHVEDLEHLIAENAQLEADNLDLIADQAE